MEGRSQTQIYHQGDLCILNVGQLIVKLQRLLSKLFVRLCEFIKLISEDRHDDAFARKLSFSFGGKETGLKHLILFKTPICLKHLIH